MSPGFFNLAFILSVMISKSMPMEDSLFQDPVPFWPEDETSSLFALDPPVEETVSLYDPAPFLYETTPVLDPGPPLDETASIFDPTLSWDVAGWPWNPDTTSEDFALNPAGASDLLEPVNSSEDWGALFPHTLFEDPHSNGELTDNLLFNGDDELDEPFEIVGCTTETYQSRRVRTRRNLCPAPLAKNPEPKRGDNKRAARNHKAILDRWPFLKDFSDKAERYQNKFCATLSRGILPLGRCPSSNPADIEPSASVALPPMGTFPGWKLKNSTPGRFDRS
jgi:hypothetical protein